MRITVAAMLILTILAAPWDAAALSRRKQCEKNFLPRVLAECQGLNTNYRRCKKAILKQCRRRLVHVTSCEVTPPSTTTSPVPPSTTTTTTRASTTTTTSLVSYGGRWDFSGTLSSDTCGGGDFYLDATVNVTHSTGSSSLSVKIGTAATMYGTADGDGFEAGESHYSDSGCLVTTALVADRTSNASRMDAGIGIDIDCGFDSCRAIWTGDLSR